MIYLARLGIAVSVFGIMLAIMGLFPSLTGFTDTLGVGIIQVAMLISGYALFNLGGFIFIKAMYYPRVKTTLAQQIGIRLTLTGLVFATLSAMADIVGFGSHVRTASSDIFFGQLQAIGILGSFALSYIGVLVYAVAGPDEKTTSRDKSATADK